MSEYTHIWGDADWCLIQVGESKSDLVQCGLHPEFVGTEGAWDVHDVNQRELSLSHFKSCLRYPLGKVGALQQWGLWPIGHQRSRQRGGRRMGKWGPSPKSQELQVRSLTKESRKNPWTCAQWDNSAINLGTTWHLFVPQHLKYLWESNTFTI